MSDDQEVQALLGQADVVKAAIEQLLDIDLIDDMSAARARNTPI